MAKNVLPINDLLKVSKKKLKLERKSFHSIFWKLKNFDSFKSYKGLNVEKAWKCSQSRRCRFLYDLCIFDVQLLTLITFEGTEIF